MFTERLERLVGNQKNNMDNRTRLILDGLLSRMPEELTQDEIAFLRARKSYLTKTQLLDFDIINQTKPLERTENGETRQTNPRRISRN